MGTTLLGLFALSNIFSLAFSAPTLAKAISTCSKMTVYDAIIKECPYLNTSKSFNQQPLLTSCLDWCKIKETGKLTKQTEEEVLCLNYYHSFVSFCKLKNQTFLTSDMLIPDLTNYTSKVCNVSNTSINDHLWVFNNESLCKRLCYDYDENVLPLCQLTHYYLLINSVMENKQTSIAPPKPNTLETSGNISTIANITIPKTGPDGALVDSKQQPKLNEHPSAQPELEEPPNVANSINSDKIPSKASDSKKITTEKLTEQNNAAGGSVVTTKNDIGPVQNTQGDEPDTPGMSEPEREMGNDNNDSGIEDEDDQGTLTYDEPKPAVPKVEQKKVKPEILDGEPASYGNTDDLDGESYFFFYFMVVCILFVLGYVGYHNRQRVLALVLEGKRGKRPYRRRPNSANYHKLDSNLEEAMSSACTKNSSHVIY